MNELLPFLSQQLNQVLEGISYIMPEVYLAILFILVLVTDLLFGRNSEKLCRIIAAVGMGMVLFKDLQQFQLLLNGSHLLFSNMILLHRPAVVFKLIIDVTAIILLLYFKWDDQLRAHVKGLPDLYSITIASILGAHMMVMAVNLLSIYLSIEMVSIASYLMVAYRSGNRLSAEAGLKYVLFGAASSAIMLYGISLLYAFSGSLDLFSNNLISGMLLANPLAVSFALILVLLGIGFKLSFIPVHFWVPDIYEGAPTPVTAFLSTIPKIAGFALLINFLTPFIFLNKWSAFDFRLYLSVIGIITMIIGNFAAVWQNNLKRMLAYSSIGHTGFALMAVVTFSTQGISALSFYLAVYALANIGAFMLISHFSNIMNDEGLESYNGLGFKYPVAGVSFVIILISLTGLPATAGFNGKLLVFSSVYNSYQQNHNIWLLILMITGALTTVVSLFYYIKIPLHMFLRKSENHTVVRPISNIITCFGFAIALLLVIFGIFPSFLADIL